eukprot:603632-Pyramimonas_sp.AAC.1
MGEPMRAMHLPFAGPTVARSDWAGPGLGGPHADSNRGAHGVLAARQRRKVRVSPHPPAARQP